MEPPIEPTRFDTIILGTGLQESVVAGALARAGRKVLHLDRSSFYGSHFASVDLEFFKPWAAAGGAIAPTRPHDIRQGFLEEPHVREVRLPSSGSGCLYSHVSVHDWSGGLGLDRPRSYSIDLCGPRVLHCGGSMVELLVASGASKYLEFKALEALLTWTTHRQGLQAVPGSRSDIFQDRSLSLVEKRHLMRFLKLVADLAPLSHTRPWDAASHPAQEVSASGPQHSGAPQPPGAERAQPPEAEGARPSEAGGAQPPEAKGAQAPGACDSVSGPSLEESLRGAPGDERTGTVGDVSASHEEHRHPSRQKLERRDGGVFAEYEGQTMEGLLESQRLPRSIQECILYGVADAGAPSPSMTADCAPLSAPQGLARLALYFRSIGRFGARSGLIYPAYGCGELPQAFCRIAAVEGALYVLQRGVASLLVEKESGSVSGVRTESGQCLWAPQVLLGPSFVPNPQAWGAIETAESSEKKEGCNRTSPLQESILGQSDSSARAGGLPGVARAVCITSVSLQEDKQYLLLSVPPWKGAPEDPLATASPSVAVRLCQLPASCSVCPTGKFLVYASAPSWRPEEETPESLLRPALDRLLDCSWGQSTKDSTGRLSHGGAETSAPLTRESTGTVPSGEGRLSSGAPGQSAELAVGADSQDGGREAEAPGATTSMADAIQNPSTKEGPEKTLEPGNNENPGAGSGPETTKPRVLWCAMFTQRIRLRDEMQVQLAPGLFCCSSPDATDNFETAMVEAQQIFAEMAPGDVFYPPKELDREVEDGDQIQEEAARGSIQKPADTDRS